VEPEVDGERPWTAEELAVFANLGSAAPVRNEASRPSGTQTAEEREADNAEGLEEEDDDKEEEEQHGAIRPLCCPRP
jgi:hypothetical protein